MFVFQPFIFHFFTLPETNIDIAPENGGPLEKEIPTVLETTIFRGYVSFRECTFLFPQGLSC